jgi:zinc dependent phospholipase C
MIVETRHALPESPIVPRATRRPFAALVFAFVLLASMATPALGWGNGGNLGNGYGTHDWIISQALKVFGDAPPAWLDVNAALLASDDPDKVFWAVNEHVFNEKGYGRGAVDRITEFYHQTLTAHLAGDDQTASIAFGWMAHYVGDILQPYHTNYAAVHLDDSHLRYENLVGKLTRSPEASPEWSTEDRSPKALADVRTSAIAAAAYSRKYFAELYSVFKVDETVLAPRVMEITGYLLKRASADLADMLYSIDQGVGEAAPAASVKTSVRWRYAAKNTTQTIYVTVKGAAGQPLEGVRVDIAFPNVTGGTRLLRRYTTRSGTVTAYAAIGASSFGTRRDLVVTVKTGDTVNTATTWFTTSRKLAARTAGFKTAVNDRTVYPGETIRVGSLARDTAGRGVPNLKVSWTLTFRNGTAVKASGYTNVLGRALTTMPITSGTPKGLVTVVARTQSGSVNRTSTTSFRIY